MDASIPTACMMRYAGNTFDLLDGNNASIQYCADTKSFQVHANRIIEKHETIGISFGEECWLSQEWDIPTLQRAQACYGAKSDTDWTSLIRRKVKQQNIMLEGGWETESEASSGSDSESGDLDPSKIQQERGDWTHQHISKPRSIIKESLQFDPL